MTSSADLPPAMCSSTFSCERGREAGEKEERKRRKREREREKEKERKRKRKRGGKRGKKKEKKRDLPRFLGPINGGKRVVVPFLSIHMISRTVVPFSPTWLGLLVHVPFIDHVGKKNINQGKRANRFADVIVFQRRTAQQRPIVW